LKLDIPIYRLARPTLTALSELRKIAVIRQRRPERREIVNPTTLDATSVDAMAA
jgi:hypothetical protein